MVESFPLGAPALIERVCDDTARVVLDAVVDVEGNTYSALAEQVLHVLVPNLQEDFVVRNTHCTHCVCVVGA